MTGDVVIKLAGVALLLCGSAFFSGAEVALFSLNRIQLRRLRHRHPRYGQVVTRLLDHPHQLLSTLSLGNIAVNIGAAILGYGVIRGFWPHRAELVAVPVMTAVLLLIGEVTPKSIMIQHAERFSLLLARPIEWCIWLTRPVRRAAETASAWLIRAIERQSYFALKEPRTASLTEEEYQTLLGVSERAGVLQREERVMVNKILALEDKLVREIMTPRVDMMFIEDILAPEDIRIALRRYKHRRVPVFHETQDHVIGILYAKDYLASDTDPVLADLLDRPQIVPDTMSVARLLKMFRHMDHPVAIVVDEHGGTEGLVTLEDALEEIVGEIEDEFDQSEVMIQRLPDGRFLVNGKAPVELVNEHCHLALEVEDVDTIAGWLVEHLDSLPREGETIQVGSVRATARRIIRNRIREVIIEVNGRAGS